jgi:hypothetical protein
LTCDEQEAGCDGCYGFLHQSVSGWIGNR